MALTIGGKQPVEVSREELYRQVWSTPMSRLAADYGISGNGLTKICDRLKVPYPPRGWWAKKAAGKRVATFRLPPAAEDTPLNATITATPPPVPPPEMPPEVEVKMSQAREAVTAMPLPERLRHPHPIIARWLAEHERKKQEARRERDPIMKRLLQLADWTASDHRQHRILDALLKALEKQGGKVKESDRGSLVASIQGEDIEFHLRAKRKQVRRPLTDEERGWDSRGKWRQELQPTGKLVLTIKTYLLGNLRTEWLESDTMSLEVLLPDIVATFVAAGPLLVEHRRQREEEARQRQIAEQKRHEEQQRRKLDNNRWRRFVELAQQQHDAQLAQRLLEAIKISVHDPQEEVAGMSLAAWISWTECRLIAKNPLNDGVQAIFEDIAGINIWSYRD